MASDVKFVRIRGRIVPIKIKKKPKHKPDVAGLALGLTGAAISILGAGKLSGLFKSKFMKRSVLLGTVFAGEAVAAEGIDKFSESLGPSKRAEQNIKNVAGGTLGVFGALSVLKDIKKKPGKLLRLVK